MHPLDQPGEGAQGGARVAVTGAAGSLAADVLPGLSARGHNLHGTDQIDSQPPGTRSFTRASLDESDQLDEVFAGQDAVVHLAGIPLEYYWSNLSRVNIDGTQNVLESARRQGVRRIVLASSIHAVGRVPVPSSGIAVPDDVAPRPSTLYGVTKAAVEALGSHYADAYGLNVTCLRIASRASRPTDQRMLSTWLSPADAVRLIHASLTSDTSGFRLVWGVSDNTRRWLSAAGGTAIGYHPHDDAEAYADQVPADPLETAHWNASYIGGAFCSPSPPRWQPQNAVDDPPPGVSGA